MSILKIRFFRVSNGARYAKKDIEKWAFISLPSVLEKGKEIGYHVKHKDRNYDTITFAAPIVLNGERCNVGVVRIEGEYYYKVHRIVEVEINKNRDTAERAGPAKNARLVASRRCLQGKDIK